MQKSEVIKVFVGEGEVPSQNELAKKRRKQGWVVGASIDDDSELKDAINDSGGKIFVINGASSSYCAPIGFARAMKAGALKGVAPLNNIAGSNGNTLADVAHDFALVLSYFMDIDDPRIIVTPTKVWNKAKADVKARRR